MGTVMRCRVTLRLAADLEDADVQRAFLEDVRQRTAERAIAHQEWREAIIAAKEDGHSARAIGVAAGVSHVRVLQILNDTECTVPHSTFPGTKSEYAAAHRRVVKQRGTPSRCERCGTEDSAKYYDWANLSGRYEDVDDYERMCRSCHRQYDSARKRAA